MDGMDGIDDEECRVCGKPGDDCSTHPVTSAAYLAALRAASNRAVTDGDDRQAAYLRGQADLLSEQCLRCHVSRTAESRHANPVSQVEVAARRLLEAMEANWDPEDGDYVASGFTLEITHLQSALKRAEASRNAEPERRPDVHDVRAKAREVCINLNLPPEDEDLVVDAFEDLLVQRPETEPAQGETIQTHPWGPGCAHDPDCASELEHRLALAFGEVSTRPKLSRKCPETASNDLRVLAEAVLFQRRCEPAIPMTVRVIAARVVGAPCPCGMCAECLGYTDEKGEVKP